jgi:hypothetical protein
MVRSDLCSPFPNICTHLVRLQQVVQRVAAPSSLQHGGLQGSGAHHNVPYLVDNNTMTVTLVGTEKLASPGDSVLHTQKVQGSGLTLLVWEFECRAHNNVPTLVDNHSLTVALVGTEKLASPEDSVLHSHANYAQPPHAHCARMPGVGASQCGCAKRDASTIHLTGPRRIRQPDHFTHQVYWQHPVAFNSSICTWLRMLNDNHGLVVTYF